MVKKKTGKQSITLELNYSHLVWVLVALNILTLLLWKPWQDSGAPDRTVTVSGETTIEATPDEYHFAPYWQITNKSRKTALERATTLANDIIADLKELGVNEKDIKLDANSYEIWYYDEAKDENSVNVSLTVEADDLKLAQKIQDYLLTKSPEGQITPWPTFSDEKQDELEVIARKQAIADARAKAQQNASELGFKLGKVVSVSEVTGFGDYPVAIAEGRDMASDSSKSLPITPGQNELNFSINVVFEIK